MCTVLQNAMGVAAGKLIITISYKSLLKLIDGGVLNPVPIAPTFSDDTHMTIAVNLGGSMVSNRPVHDVPKEPVADSMQLHEKISSFIRQFQQNDGSESELNWGVYDIANQAFDAMQSTIARQKLAAYPPDYTIEIARNACGTLESRL